MVVNDYEHDYVRHFRNQEHGCVQDGIYSNYTSVVHDLIMKCATNRVLDAG